jgi:hypothetical protein
MGLLNTARGLKREICNGPCLQNPDAGFGVAVIVFLTAIRYCFRALKACVSKRKEKR